MRKNTFIWLLVGVLLIAGLVWLVKVPSKPGKLDAFVGCIKDRGAIYYGAFWCPRCQEQGGLFGRSKSLLPYVECSTPDGKSQLPVCADAGITGYPTWQFADGSRQTGVLSLERLSELTSCELPQE